MSYLLNAILPKLNLAEIAPGSFSISPFKRSVKVARKANPIMQKNTNVIITDKFFVEYVKNSNFLIIDEIKHINESNKITNNEVKELG